MTEKNFSVYSLADVKVTMNNKKVGKKVISDCGGGRIVISYSGDLSSHTVTATGFVVVNKMRSYNGTVTLELPQNSEADNYCRKLIKHLSNTTTDQFAVTNLTLEDKAAKRTITCKGLTPQKKPDENYDQASGTRNYTFLVAEVIW